MKKIILLALIVICALVVVHAFFLPWAKANTSATRVAKGLVSQSTGKLKDTPFAENFIKIFNKTTDQVANLGDIEVKTAVSGYGIPTLINKKTSQVAIAIASVMFKDAKDLDKKSMLVYLVPLIALLCIGLAVLGLKNNIAIIVMALISGAISIVGLYNLMTINVSNLVVTISIERGLWQTMYSYLLICIIGIIWIVTDVLGSRKKV